MNTMETAEYTGIPFHLLVLMRRRATSTLRSGPPFAKKYDKNGIERIVYHKTQVDAWIKKRKFLITANEAAKALGLERVDLLEIQGTKRFDMQTGYIVVEPSKNIFIYCIERMKNERSA